MFSFRFFLLCLVPFVVVLANSPCVNSQQYNGTAAPILVYSYTQPGVSCSNSYLNIGVLNENLNLTHLYPLRFNGASYLGTAQTYNPIDNIVYTNMLNGGAPGILALTVTTHQRSGAFLAVPGVEAFYSLDPSQFTSSFMFSVINLFWTPSGVIYLLWWDVAGNEDYSIVVSSFDTQTFVTSTLAKTPFGNYYSRPQPASVFHQKENRIYFEALTEDSGTLFSFDISTNKLKPVQNLEESSPIWNCTNWAYNTQNDQVYSVCNNPHLADMFISTLNLQKGTTERVGTTSISLLPSLVWPQTLAIDANSSLAYFSWTPQNPVGVYYSKVDLTTGESTSRVGDTSVPLWFAYAPTSISN